MVAAMCGFALNDAMVKLATQEIEPAQIMAVRGAMASVLLFALAWWRGMLRPAGPILSAPVAWRTVFDLLATISYITALTQLPLANASAIFQALPLAITLGAVLFLGEKVGWRRWLAILVGFLGVVIIVRPGTEGFTVYSLAVLASVVCSAARDIFTRKMSRGLPSVLVAAVGALSITVFGLALLPFVGWRAMSVETTAALCGAALAIAFGYVCVVAATRVGEVGFVAPFRYTILLFAIVLGFLIFAELPAFWDMVGSAIVVGSGIYMIYRERRVSRVKLAPTQGH